MKKPVRHALLSSSFGTVSMGQTIQTLAVLALDNLFMETPCAAAHPARTVDAFPLNVMTLSSDRGDLVNI